MDDNFSPIVKKYSILKKLLEKVEGAEAFWILSDGSVHYTEKMGKMLQSKGATNK